MSKKSSEIVKGLIILEKYDNAISPGHDIIYAGPADPSEVSAEDAKELESLGWFICHQETSWAIFT
jgi:hypothetical protein